MHPFFLSVEVDSKSPHTSPTSSEDSSELLFRSEESVSNSSQSDESENPVAQISQRGSKKEKTCGDSQFLCLQPSEVGEGRVGQRDLGPAYSGIGLFVF